MPTKVVVIRVWIEPGCVACRACETMCPDVFEVRAETCIIRPEALDGGFTRPRTQEIMAAAEACPVEVIKFETVEVGVQEAPGSEAVSRRGVISAAGVGWVALGGSVVLSGAVVQRFIFPNVSEEPDPTVRLGELSTYAELPIGGVSEAFKPLGVWVVRLKDSLAALSIICTHLGCLTDWVQGERKFKCPCHGSVFLQDGMNVEGPAPRALDRLKIWLEDGIVVVDRSKKFQRERGQWRDPDSFISV